MNISKIVPHFVVREDAATCNCHVDDVCDCMPGLYLTRDGLHGFGSAVWTYADETCPEAISHYGMAYWCTFLDYSFWAMGEMDAAEQLLKKLDSYGHPAKVNFVNNNCASELIKQLKETTK